MRFHFALADFANEANTSFFRCQIPARALEEAGHFVTLDHFIHLEEIDPAKYDVIIIERNLFDANITDFVRRAKGKTRLVCTFDDAYAFMPDYVTSKETWSQERLSLFSRILRQFDVVIVPSTILVEDHNYCKDVRFVPNFYDKVIYQDLPAREDDGKIHILWGGNSTHRESLLDSGIMPALNKICAKFKRVVVDTIGTPEVTNIFKEALPQDKLRIWNWMPLEQYASFVARTADIGIAPLAGEYDRRRSWVKATEFGLAGVPLVASDLEPYRNTGALLVGSDDWYDMLKDLVANPPLRERMVKPLKEFVESHSIQDNIKVYEDLVK